MNKELEEFLEGFLRQNQPTRKFCCMYHAQQAIAWGWKDVFVLECGCSYKLYDTTGVVYMNTTASNSKGYNA